MPKLQRSGQVYFGLLISMGILAILSQAIITLVFTSYEILTYTNARANARAIAVEQMENIHNLPYASVGTVGGIPSGVATQNQTIQRNGLNYTVRTNIVYIDDPYDNLAPIDTLPTDYKRVRIDISWGGISASRGDSVTLISDIAPNGIETTTGGGILYILVFNASGLPVPQASVNIVAPSVSPPVNLTLNTDNNGVVILPGAPPCNSCYQITVTKPSYSTDRTYSTTEVANPSKPYQSVLQGQLTQASFAIDLTSTLTIKSTGDRLSNFSPIGNIPFKLRGNKIIGTDSQGQNVYKYNESLTTDGGGNLTINNLEWDTYQFTLNSTSYDIAGTNPLLPINILPNATDQFMFANTTHTNNTLLSIFTDQGNNPIASVEAQITNGSLVASASSGLSSDPDYGQAFFGELTNQPYLLEATVSGFQYYKGNVNVSGQTVEKVNLTPQ